MDYSERFWANIERIIQEKNMTWTELSRRLGIARINLVHSKSYHNVPRAERLKKLSEVLETSADELINV